MDKREVRCFRGFASLPGLANIEVFYTVPEFGYDHRLFICIECGAVLVLDVAGHANKTIQQVIAGIPCPQCHRQLATTIRAYPATFRYSDGRLGQFDAGHLIPPASESLVMKFFDIASASSRDATH